MKGDFVTVEIAKKLKEKGYTGKKTGKFVEKIPGTEREEWDDAEMMYVTVTDVVTYPRAHIYDVLKWLREEKGMHIEINLLSGGWSYVIKEINPLCGFDRKVGTRYGKSYEEVAIAGIEYTLDNLI